MKNLVVLSVVSLLGFAVLSLSGCGDANPEASAVTSANKTNLQRLANLYGLHQLQNKYEGPADEAAFKEFIKNTDPRMLEPMGVDPGAVDELFVSERDGEPFSIRYNITSGPRGSSEPAVFEATGKNGKRMVGFLNMVQQEVDSSEYERLMAGKGSSPAAASSSRKSGDDRSGG